MSSNAPDESPVRETLSARMRRSPATAALIIAFVGVLVATWLDPEDRLFSAFAKLDDRVRAGEVWRLFTASFLHAGVLHLWFNATALASIGPTLERVYGRTQFVGAFLISGAAGMLASTLFTPAPSVGASAGVFGLVGLLLAYAVRHRALLGRGPRRSLVVQLLSVVALNLAIGLLARFIDNAAHLGGLAGGFALGLALRPRQPLLIGSAAPLSPPRAPAISGRGRSFMGWAGQRWKLVAFLVGLVPSAAFWAGDHQDLSWLWVHPLAFFAGMGIAASARCPRCEERVVWWCLSELPASRGLETALRSESCPLCGYPDTPEEPTRPPSGRGSPLEPGGFFDRARR